MNSEGTSQSGQPVSDKPCSNGFRKTWKLRVPQIVTGFRPSHPHAPSLQALVFSAVLTQSGAPLVKAQMTPTTGTCLPPVNTIGCSVCSLRVNSDWFSMCHVPIPDPVTVSQPTWSCPCLPSSRLPLAKCEEGWGSTRGNQLCSAKRKGQARWAEPFRGFPG